LHVTTGLFLHAYEVSKTAVDFDATAMLRQLRPPKISVLATGLVITFANKFHQVFKVDVHTSAIYHQARLIHVLVLTFGPTYLFAQGYNTQYIL